jgi:hypothetical protein
LDPEYKQEYLMQAQLVYAGVDIAKTTLVVHFQGCDARFPNTTEGCQQLPAWLAKLNPKAAMLPEAK